MVAIEENNQLRRHQIIIPRNKNSTLRYLYLINSCSTYNKNLCLHFYQQPMTMLCEVLGRITLSSLTPILFEFCLHFLSARFLLFFFWADLAEIHDWPEFISDFSVLVIHKCTVKNRCLTTCNSKQHENVHQ